MRVCYFGTYRAGYSRNQIMIEGLKRNQVEIVECQEDLWRGIDDRVKAASGKWLYPPFIMRVVRTYIHLIRKYFRLGKYDVMVLGYPGQIDVFLARVLTWVRGRPLVMDIFMSIYLIAYERGLTARSPLTGRLIYAVEKAACRLPDLLILDTIAYVEWFCKTYELTSDRFRLVPTGADDRVFYVRNQSGKVSKREDERLFRLLYYGTFIPNHGIEYIVEAAKLLNEDRSLHFELAGDGPTRSHAEYLVKKYGLTNVTFTGWTDKKALPGKIMESDVCLGAFGTTPQSLMTIQNKIYEGLAMGKPVITGEAPMIRQALEHGKHIYLVKRESGMSLAKGIQNLKRDVALRNRLAREGQVIFHSYYTPKALGVRFREFLMDRVDSSLNQVRI